MLTQKELKRRSIARNLTRTAKALEALRGKCATAQLAVSGGLAEARKGHVAVQQAGASRAAG